MQQAKFCGVCSTVGHWSMVGHTFDICPQVQKGVFPEVNSRGAFQRKYDPLWKHL